MSDWAPQLGIDPTIVSLDSRFVYSMLFVCIYSTVGHGIVHMVGFSYLSKSGFGWPNALAQVSTIRGH